MEQVMLLQHFQKAGHKPIALIGGATGMVGDPSGKSQERNLLDEETLNYNLACQKAQLEKFLDFDCGENSAEIVNNYDWFKAFGFLEFIRDIGKHISVNYMLAKDSVKNRLDSGMSFTEFSYQLVQGYDFLHLYQHNNVLLQMGGSDQWGNIVTGTELIRRKIQGEAFALTTPLIKKADGTKFGKSEGGNIWLDPKKTSPYKFYQFWLKSSDEDVKNYIRIFTLLGQDEIEALEAEHTKDPGRNILQKKLAEIITTMVHSEEDYHKAVEASLILFGKSTSDVFKSMDEQTFLDVFEGVDQSTVSMQEVEAGINVVEFLADKTGVFPSRGQCRDMIKGGGVSINKEKVTDMEMIVSRSNFINDKYLVAQKGKSKNFLIRMV